MQSCIMTPEISLPKEDKKIYSYLKDNITIEDIPEPILEIYKEINLTLRD